MTTGPRVRPAIPTTMSQELSRAVAAAGTLGATDWAKLARNCTRLAFSASACAALLMGYTVQLARVQGQSMAPTLADEDRLIVDKLAYRIGNPTPGDIVMFYAPAGRGQIFVKRIVAQPGDLVRIQAGRVFINDRLLNDPYVIAPFRSHENWGPYRVPDGYFVVMGDHRNRSSDSRHWGPVPRDAIIGKVHARWWPIAQASLF
jgi:signal peptidase I